MEQMSQFHYGSIKTRKFWYINKQKQRSQFHYGSIKTETFEFVEGSFTFVSIPLWFD